ncbi:MAG: hypothetical protein FJ368_03160 [Pelagibacterales bacterium]|nr:hypothetical protein [Pelagibacterales bacterium]
MNLDFKNKTQQQKNVLIGQGYFYIQEMAKHGKNIEIVEMKEGKSYLQLRAIYKLFQLCLPHFEKWKPTIIWDLEKIKEFVKTELKYTRPITPYEAAMLIKQRKEPPVDNTEKESMYDFYLNQVKNISFADFTKEQAYNFANDLEVWAQTSDEKTKKTAWENVFLTNAEKEAYWTSLEKMFNKQDI